LTGFNLKISALNPLDSEQNKSRFRIHLIRLWGCRIRFRIYYPYPSGARWNEDETTLDDDISAELELCSTYEELLLDATLELLDNTMAFELELTFWFFPIKFTPSGSYGLSRSCSEQPKNKNAKANAKMPITEPLRQRKSGLVSLARWVLGLRSMIDFLRKEPNLTDFLLSSLKTNSTM